jgi:hypothetical protein
MQNTLSQRVPFRVSLTSVDLHARHRTINYIHYVNSLRYSQAVTMEPYPKRQRLYVPLSRKFPQSFDNQHAFYDEPPDTELEDDVDEELEEEEEEEEEEVISDPDAELQQRRAQLDYKLKSTFEAIFEKYGQDFDGVGDEIDLETGDIVVDNGHLLEMQDERDAGDTSRARHLLRDFTEEPDETDDIPSSSLEETEILDIEDDEEVLSDGEEMMEDDMILRGFAKANRFMQASPELGPSTAVPPPRKDHRQATISRPSKRRNSLPSKIDILAQFGPQLGPQIVDFVSQQKEPHDSHIEPAWRAPELPNFAPVKHPTIKPIFLAPEIERFPSPEAVESVWAPVRARGRRRLDGADSDAIFRGESLLPMQKRKSQPLGPFRCRSMLDSSQPTNIPLPRVKGSRKKFTAEDDRVLLDWVAKGRAQGLALWSLPIWRGLEAKVFPPPIAARQSNELASIRTTPLAHGGLTTSDVLHIFQRTRQMDPKDRILRHPSTLIF